MSSQSLVFNFEQALRTGGFVESLSYFNNLKAMEREAILNSSIVDMVFGSVVGYRGTGRAGTVIDDEYLLKAMGKKSEGGDSVTTAKEDSGLDVSTHKDDSGLDVFVHLELFGNTPMPDAGTGIDVFAMPNAGDMVVGGGGTTVWPTLRKPATGAYVQMTMPGEMRVGFPTRAAQALGRGLSSIMQRIRSIFLRRG
jgi:hypothetical protein